MADSGEDETHLFRRASEFVGRAALRPRAPAIALMQPKYAHNVGQAVRIASCYGIGQVWYSGSRVKLATAGERLPREERMKGYSDVTLVNDPDPLGALIAADPGAVPVAIELRPGAEPLPDFQHPERAIYVFGPEDGSLGGAVLKRCHRFVVIPTVHCLNLATSVGTVLYDRTAKAGAALSVAGELRVAR
jgi:tRNA(Leu) C34 or U34 (ribose-2'-O)-methylase TrmL